MAGKKERSWHILAMGRGQSTAEKAQKHLHEIGYKNAIVMGVDNDKASDDKLIQLLAERQWDAVSIGGGVNGFDDDFPKEVTTLHWFNRLVNIIHEHAPKTKFIFVASPNDLADSFERILGAAEAAPKTV